MLKYNIEAMHSAGVENIVVVRGYLHEKITFPGVKYIENHRYADTNMVATLFCALEEFDDDLLVSYSDIIYRVDVVRTLLEAPAEIGVVVDHDWHSLWALRMEDPLRDAETLKIDTAGNILEIGKKPNSFDDIEGQYIGLIKFSRAFLPTLKDFYASLDRNADYDGKNFDNMFMTTFLQLMIDAGFPVKAVPINGGWLELDTLHELEVYEDKKSLQF